MGSTTRHLLAPFPALSHTLLSGKAVLSGPCCRLPPFPSPLVLTQLFGGRLANQIGGRMWDTCSPHRYFCPGCRYWGFFAVKQNDSDSKAVSRARLLSALGEGDSHPCMASGSDIPLPCQHSSCICWDGESARAGNCSLQLIMTKPMPIRCIMSV